MQQRVAEGFEQLQVGITQSCHEMPANLHGRSKQTHKRLKNLAKTKPKVDDDAASAGNLECSICLMSVAVSVRHCSGLAPMTNSHSLANHSSWHLVPIHGTTNASGQSSMATRGQTFSVPIAAPLPTSMLTLSRTT